MGLGNDARRVVRELGENGDAMAAADETARHLELNAEQVHLAQAFSDVFTLEVIAYITLGVFIGYLVGALPGLNRATAIALLIPFTFTMPALAAISFLIGIATGLFFDFISGDKAAHIIAPIFIVLGCLFFVFKRHLTKN